MGGGITLPDGQQGLEQGHIALQPQRGGGSKGQRADCLRVRAGEPEGDHTAQRMAQDMRRPEAEVR